MRYSNLIFPKAMNLHLLSEILDDDQMMKLILRNEGKERRARRIILPSRKLIRKCIIYFLATKHKENFEEVIKELRGKLDTPDEDIFRKDKIIELYQQRKKEIENEKNNS